MIPTYKIEFDEKEQNNFGVKFLDASTLVEEAVRLYISFNLRPPKNEVWNPPLTKIELSNLVTKALTEFDEQKKIVERDGTYYWHTEKQLDEDDVLG